MRISHNIRAPTFTRRVMGGFVLQHRRDPPYTVCGRSSVDSVCRDFFQSLQPCGGRSSGQLVYVTPLSDFRNRSCAGLDFNSSVTIGSEIRECESGDGGSDDGEFGDGEGEYMCESLDLQPGYEVDGMGADLLNKGVCDSEGVSGDGESDDGESDDGEIGGGVSGDGVTRCVGNKNRVSAHYYKEIEEMLSVTVWYNNRVSFVHKQLLSCMHTCTMYM